MKRVRLRFTIKRRSPSSSSFVAPSCLTLRSFMNCKALVPISPPLVNVLPVAVAVHSKYYKNMKVNQFRFIPVAIQLDIDAEMTTGRPFESASGIAISPGRRTNVVSVQHARTAEVVVVVRILCCVVVVVEAAARNGVDSEEASGGGVVGACAHDDKAGGGVELLVPAADEAVGGGVVGDAVEWAAEGVVRVVGRLGAAGVGFGGEVAMPVVVEEV